MGSVLGGLLRNSRQHDATLCHVLWVFAAEQLSELRTWASLLLFCVFANLYLKTDLYLNTCDALDGFTMY